VVSVLTYAAAALSDPPPAFTTVTSLTFTAADELLERAGSLSATPAVFVLDTDMGSGREREGLQLLRDLDKLRRERGDDFYLAVLTSHGEVMTDATNLGADLFLQKSSSVQTDSLELQSRLFRRDTDKSRRVFDELKSRLAQELVRRTKRAADDKAQAQFLYDDIIPESLQRLSGLPSLSAAEKDVILTLTTLVRNIGSDPQSARRRELLREGSELLLPESDGRKPALLLPERNEPREDWKRRVESTISNGAPAVEAPAEDPLIVQPPTGVQDVRVEFIDISQALYDRLIADPAELLSLTAERFEHLVADRLTAMGMTAKIMGHVNARDGGIDIVFFPHDTGSFPFFGAVQVKHHRSIRKTTGPDVVRLTAEAVSRHRFNVGMVITNTRFTPDAQWFAESYPALLRLRDFDDLMRWFRGNFSDEREWREIPRILKLCRGVEVKIRD